MKEAIIFLSLAFLQMASGQQPPLGLQLATSPSASKPIPQHLLYRYFLKWVSDLDDKAAASGSDDPYKFAGPFAERVGLEHSHLDIIRTEAKALEKDIAVRDAKAAAIVARFRAVGREALQFGRPIPVAPVELRELQQERDTLVKSHVSVMRAALGPKAAEKLDAYLFGEFAPHVNLKALAVPNGRAAPNAR